jgi:hypothetical protein
MVKHKPWVIAVCIGLGTICGEARADEGPHVEEARTRFQRGVDSYKDGDYQAAFVEFRRAYDLVHHWRILFNIAQACGEMQDYPCALKSFERYLSEGGAEVPAARREEVGRELARIHGRIAKVTLTVNRPNAEIFVDATSVGRSPLSEPIMVSAGRRRFSAALPSGQTIAKTADVAGGDSVAVQLDFAGEPAPASQAEVVGPPRTTSATPVYVGLAVTGAVGVATAITGFMAVSAKGNLDRALDAIPGSASDIDSARGRLRTYSLAADVLAGVTVVAAGVTLYLALTRSSKPASATASVFAGPAWAFGRF